MCVRARAGVCVQIRTIIITYLVLSYIFATSPNNDTQLHLVVDVFNTLRKNYGRALCTHVCVGIVASFSKSDIYWCMGEHTRLYTYVIFGSK